MALFQWFKNKKTWRILSKIGLVNLNVRQKDEFCVKLVAPLLHNQMMWYILQVQVGHVLATAFTESAEVREEKYYIL